MDTLDKKWLEENYIEGDYYNTNVGDTVYAIGYDEEKQERVLFPREVTGWDEDCVVTKEKDGIMYIPLSERGMFSYSTWYIVKG